LRFFVRKLGMRVDAPAYFDELRCDGGNAGDDGLD
jgi:hypothetical protein